MCSRQTTSSFEKPITWVFSYVRLFMCIYTLSAIYSAVKKHRGFHFSSPPHLVPSLRVTGTDFIFIPCQYFLNSQTSFSANSLILYLFSKTRLENKIYWTSISITPAIESTLYERKRHIFGQTTVREVSVQQLQASRSKTFRCVGQT